jgi:hypothetical protein
MFIGGDEPMEAIHAAIVFISTHGAELAVGAGVYLGSVAASLGAATTMLVRMPDDYLDRPETVPLWPERPRWMQKAGRVGKNLLGVAVLATGVGLAVPGVPGSGVLTILVGLMILDIPGKRRIERRILGAPKVLAVVNRVRARFGRSPLRIRPASHAAAPGAPDA